MISKTIQLYNSRAVKVLELTLVHLILLLSLLNNFDLLPFTFVRAPLMVLALMLGFIRLLLVSGHISLNKLGLAALLLAGYMTAVTLLTKEKASVVSALSVVLYWGLMLVALRAYENEQEVKKTFRFITCFFVTFEGMVYAYAVVRILPGFLSDAVAYTTAINSIYFLLAAVPLVLSCHKRAMRTMALIALSIAIIVSQKGVPIAILVALITGKYLAFSNSKKRITTVMVFSVFAIVLLAMSMSANVRHSANNVISKVSSELLDGNGRYSIYSNAWGLFTNSSPLQMLFGNGFDAVVKQLNIGAHNDFLEILFDYGILGFVLYINLWMVLLRYTGHACYRQKNHVSYLSSMIIFFLGSMLSSMINTQVQMLLLIYFWGLEGNEKPLCWNR